MHKKKKVCKTSTLRSYQAGKNTIQLTSILLCNLMVICIITLF